MLTHAARAAATQLNFSHSVAARAKGPGQGKSGMVQTLQTLIIAKHARIARHADQHLFYAYAATLNARPRPRFFARGLRGMGDCISLALRAHYGTLHVHCDCVSKVSCSSRAHMLTGLRGSFLRFPPIPRQAHARLFGLT